MINLCKVFKFCYYIWFFQGEKASAEREIKRLQGQKVLLERDISKRESIAGRRRDSIMVDSKRLKDQQTSDHLMQVL